MRTKPNIILMTSDQLRPFELGCYGSSDHNSPNIDKLASNSKLFRTAITPNPTCTAARACMMSGQYSRYCNGYLGNCNEPIRKRNIFPDPILSEVLKANGYDTALIGKWHMDTHPKMVGFDEATFPKVSHVNVGQLYYKDDEAFTVEGYVPEYELGVFKDYINRKRDNPFFIYHNISLPHMPYFVFGKIKTNHFGS